MSAAESADPTRPYAMNAGGDAAVIPLNKHRAGRGGRRSGGGWRNTMTPPPNPNADDEYTEAAKAYADTLEKTFLAVRRSLTEPDTAEVFLLTLDIWQRVLEGSHANGIIDAGQLEELTEVIEGMKQAPRLL
jgi:hypothetical protein